jgi:hypothetical protein
MKKIDLVGERYGRLVVEEFSHSSRQKRIWKCVCDCGNETFVDTARLRNGHTQSCGCLQKEGARKGIREYHKNKEVLPYSEYVINLKYGHYKRGAEKRGLEFGLSKEEFAILLQEPCHYCGTERSNVYNQHQRIGRNEEFRYNGIDRKDNEIGYVSSNVVSSCVVCNRGKNSMSYEEYVEWIKSVKWSGDNE